MTSKRYPMLAKDRKETCAPRDDPPKYIVCVKKCWEERTKMRPPEGYECHSALGKYQVLMGSAFAHDLTHKINLNVSLTIFCFEICLIWCIQPNLIM